MAKEIIKAVKGTVRIGPRISRATYMQAKYIYATKGMSFEERIEELLDKDIEYQMKQKWFLDGLNKREHEKFEGLRKSVKNSGDVDSSLFDSNNLDRGGDQDE